MAQTAALNFMKNWSIPAGNISGIELRVHLSFIGLLAVVWVIEGAASGAQHALRVLALVAIIFGSVVAHELGHAVVALRHGMAVRSIVLLPLGGVTLMNDSSQRTIDPRREIRIAVAGPVVNIALGVFFATGILLFLPQVKLLTHPFIFSGNLPRSLAWVNLMLGLFNLLPAYPLDGGHVLRAMFATRVDYLRATRRAVTVGQIFATVFVLAGALTNIWLVIIGLFLFFGSQLEDRSAVFHSVLESVKMEDVMLTDFKTLSTADTLEDALHKAVHSLQDDFPVVRGMDLVGVISRQKILDSLRDEGNGYVQSAMNKVFQVAQRNETLASVFGKVGKKGLSVVPVVEGEHLVGIVTLQNLMHSMAVLAESRRLQQETQ